MSFFDKGKNKDKDKQNTDNAGNKESFALFKKAAPAADEAPETKGRFLTLIRGQEAQPSAKKEPALAAPETPVAATVKPGAANPQEETPEAAPPVTASAPIKANSFSLKRKTVDPASAPVSTSNVSSNNTKPGVSPAKNQAAPQATQAPVVVDANNTAPAKKSSLKLPSFDMGGVFKKKATTPVNEGGVVDAKKTKSTDRARTSGKATLGASKDFHVYIELENGKEFFWAVTANHVQEIDRKKVSRAASFSRADVSLKAAGALAFKGAEDLALQELGEPVHVVNRSKDLTTVYATAEERALTSTFRIFPGQQAIDKLVKDAKLTGQSIISGFVFTDQDGRALLCILFYINPDGVTTKPQITLNPDNMEFVLSQFATSRKINKKDATILLFNNADFLGQVNGLQAYPEERVWRGIPVSSMVRTSAVIAVAGAGALAAWAGFNFYQVTLLNKSIHSLEAKAKSNKEQTSKLVAASISPFAKAMSLDEGRAFAIAQKVWQPSSKVFMTASLTQMRYEIKLPLNSNKQFNNRPSVDSTPQPDAVKKATNFQPPEGCTKENTSVSGNLNEIQITVVCESPDSPLSSFRND